MDLTKWWSSWHQPGTLWYWKWTILFLLFIWASRPVSLALCPTVFRPAIFKISREKWQSVFSHDVPQFWRPLWGLSIRLSCLDFDGWIFYVGASPMIKIFTNECMFYGDVLKNHEYTYRVESRLYVQVGTQKFGCWTERDLQVKIIFRITLCKVFWWDYTNWTYKREGLTTERRITETLL